MLKARIKVYIITLVVLFVVSLLFSWFKTINIDEWFGIDIGVQVKSDYDSTLEYDIADKKIGNYNVRLKTENPNVIIEDASSKIIDGYNKTEKAFYSPLVLFVKNEAFDNSGGFAKVETNSTDGLKVDLRKILDGMLNDKTWGDIGIHKSVAKDKICLVIPNERSAYHNTVIELFYLTMNNGVIPDSETKEKLKETVDTLVSKCEMVYDVREAIKTEVENKSSNGKVFIGPEYLFISMGYGTMSYSNNYEYMPAYFYKTINIYMDLHEQTGAYEPTFLSQIKQTNDIFEFIGFRVKDNSTYCSKVKNGVIDFLP